MVHVTEADATKFPDRTRFELAKKALELYLETESMNKVARQMGVSSLSIRSWLIKLGKLKEAQEVILARLENRRDRLAKTCANEYKAGMSLQKICRKYHVKIERARQFIEEAGLRIRVKRRYERFLDDETIKQAIEDHEILGRPYPDIALKLGISRRMLAKDVANYRLYEMGQSPRKRKRRNDDARAELFRYIDHPETYLPDPKNLELEPPEMERYNEVVRRRKEGNPIQCPQTWTIKRFGTH